MTTNSLELTSVEKAIERCWKCAEESSDWFAACSELVGMRTLLTELDMRVEWGQAKLAWDLAYNRMNKATELVVRSKLMDHVLEVEDSNLSYYFFHVYGRANAVLNLLRCGMGKQDGYTSEDLIEILEGILEK